MNISATKTFVKQKFSGVTDLGGAPYYNHLLFVMNNTKSSNKEDKIIALLHDVVEDTSVTLDELKSMGYSDYVVSGVDAITRRKGEAYSSYLSRVKAHKGAVVVKIADITHNSDLSRLKRKINSVDIKRIDKYKKARKFLGEGMKNYRNYLVENVGLLATSEVKDYDKLSKRMSSDENQGALAQLYKYLEPTLHKIKTKYLKFIQKMIPNKLKQKTKILIGVKSFNSVVSKVIKRGEKLSDVRDLVRAAALFETQEDAEKLYKDILRKHSSKVFKNSFKAKGSDKKFGYFGSFHINLVFEGLPIELQIMTKKLWSYKESAHEFYNKYRDDKDPTPDKFDRHMSNMQFSKGNQPKFRNEEIEIIYEYVVELYDENSIDILD